MKEEIKVQVLELVVIMVTICGMFFWSRSEGRADARRLEELLSSMHQETYIEMRDFHGRLCAIEERKKMAEEK
jgi:hypothetical protein